jgi:hypothetical protein
MLVVCSRKPPSGYYSERSETYWIASNWTAPTANDAAHGKEKTLGYTHYTILARFVEADAVGYHQALPALRDIAKRYRKILAFSLDQPKKPPQIDKNGIFLNGRGEAGYETFQLRLPPLDAKPEAVEFPIREFCKTNYKAYDPAICELLLVAKAHMPNLEIDSDGFSGYLADAERDPMSVLDGAWPGAIEDVKRYNVTTAVTIKERRAPYCDIKVEPTLAR